MMPHELPPLAPTLPATPVRRIETGQRRQPQQRRPTPQRPATDVDTVDEQGHIDTHV